MVLAWGLWTCKVHFLDKDRVSSGRQGLGLGILGHPQKKNYIHIMNVLIGIINAVAIEVFESSPYDHGQVGCLM